MKHSLATTERALPRNAGFRLHVHAAFVMLALAIAFTAANPSPLWSQTGDTTPSSPKGTSKPDASSGDPLAPSADQLGGTEVEGARPSRSISEEPDRLKRGGHDLADCLKMWEPATHMTKAQWKATCKRLGR